MSQQVVLCHNKDQAELKPETKIVATSHNSVATQNSESALKGKKTLL